MAASSEKWRVKNSPYMNIKSILLLFPPFFPTVFTALEMCLKESLHAYVGTSMSSQARLEAENTEHNRMFHFF